MKALTVDEKMLERSRRRGLSFLFCTHNTDRHRERANGSIGSISVVRLAVSSSGGRSSSIVGTNGDVVCDLGEARVVRRVVVRLVVSAVRAVVEERLVLLAVPEVVDLLGVVRVGTLSLCEAKRSKE